MDVSVDQRLARATALALVRPGPKLTAEKAREVVADLRSSAEQAADHVGRITGLQVPPADPAVAVIDRPSWIRSNLAMMGELLAGPAGASRPSVAERASSVQLGAMMAFLSGSVLGQFDPFGDPQRLLLVAPNIVSVQQKLGLRAHDFRLWVCLHEETHRVQFTHAPWLADHLRDHLRSFLDNLQPGGISMIIGGADYLQQIARNSGQEEVLDQLVATMSLLEGHADVIMDEVGPAVVPTVRTIRRRFDARRQAKGFAAVIRKVFGLDAKLRQYTEGAAFCRAVMAEVGMSGLNHIWTSPNTLPNAAEIAEPTLWLSRMGSLPRV
ncbi:zinc-dependent metalloprotease [Naumannella halotolerans]|uniref:Putative hydrolase/coenzyme F420 biosynthesis associated uncharacterized protein n=1 Tax=Naumannella halotolerans TaxID=993414 RepID=A0A4V3EML9_9ACTN|nr:zinc-dependent metalloprotease [Naumannella halotolerans]TDT29928.1 putative hydrolase/coenzyme F420 biosynthesis associated uncharacterized protein [Naumannella halotolerans]